MPWEKISSSQLAKRLDINYEELKLKHDLIAEIIRVRKQLNMTQVQLAKALGISQSRVAKIESRIGTQGISFDIIFRIFGVLGYTCVIKPIKNSHRKKIAA